MEKIAKQEAMEALVDMLNNDEFKKSFVKKVNKNVNIPIINEKTEAKILDFLYELVVEHVNEVASKSLNEVAV